VGAVINGKMVPLRTRLQNGDIVEILTQAGHKPSRDWLAVRHHLARARNKIKHVLQGEERARSLELGAPVRKGGAPLRPEPEDAARSRTRS
jgi:GTP pyrophosphokinase